MYTVPVLYTDPPALAVNIMKNAESSSIVVQWDEVDDSLTTTYTVTWASERDHITHPVSLIEQSSHTIIGLTLDTVYTITVTAANKCGQGPEYSTRVSLTIDATISTFTSITPTNTVSISSSIVTINSASTSHIIVNTSTITTTSLSSIPSTTSIIYPTKSSYIDRTTTSSGTTVRLGSSSITTTAVNTAVFTGTDNVLTTTATTGTTTTTTTTTTATIGNSFTTEMPPNTVSSTTVTLNNSADKTGKLFKCFCKVINCMILR